jgi:hypothetical protein
MLHKSRPIPINPNKTKQRQRDRGRERERERIWLASLTAKNNNMGHDRIGKRPKGISMEEGDEG